MITIDDLRKRKETILEDIEKVETAIRQLDEQRVSLQANLYALQGAAQQVDYFMNDEGDTEDGIITTQELCIYLKRKVTIDSNNLQTPKISNLTSDEGEFVFFSSLWQNNTPAEVAEVEEPIVEITFEEDDSPLSDEEVVAKVKGNGK